ncbi:glycosyl hydrolase family 18 protein [Nocardia huaxiensis]|uniref:glycosyl hydrolase family 18 protein n=1 Tax=Nocardia huaxiensis TaxID=2755382 RepID=UPI001E2A3DF7|nr:glycosyl hydrolase family 18 protein [Nocardia huaxiensis]UFS94742.1 glycosyl hydrolase family 18 protein [Nocardia huaxiensis]
MLLTPVGVAAIYLLRLNAGEPAADARTRGRDAIWLGHAWVDGRKSDADIAQLGVLLSGTGIKDLYVHTGPLEFDGSLRESLYPNARWFVEAVHRTLPGIRVQSWLGQVLAPEFDPGLDVEDAATRDRVVASAAKVLELGFDGIHFDVEPVRSDPAGFLTLLERTRELTRSQGRLLSVSAPVIDPLPGLHSVGLALVDHGKWWSQSYFAEVARRSDQVAVMSYDTAMPTKALYGGYVAQQTRLALEVTPDSVDLLMGAPAFWADDAGHHGAAETVSAALRGIRLGLGRTDPQRQTFGVALYVDFAATPQDWADFRRDWS